MTTPTALAQDLKTLEYLLEQREAPCLHIWTIRLSPSKRTYKNCPVGLNKDRSYTRDEWIEKMFNSLGVVCPMYVVYGESSGKSPAHLFGHKIDHYHARIAHENWGTAANLYKWIKKWFPDEGGNALFATKKVWVQGKGYGIDARAKSLTYVCKDKHRLKIRNYPLKIIELAEKIGSSWKTSKKSDPIYKQVITLNSIHERTHGILVVRHVLSFYEKANKPPPTYYQLTRILHNIKYAVSPAYREMFSQKAISFYDHGCLDGF